MALTREDESPRWTAEAEESEPVHSRRLPPRVRTWILVVIYLVLLFSSVSYLKIRACQTSFARFEAKETGMFWSEAAVQYRYAKMIADGKRIPEYDQDLQYPEGVRPHETLTLPMEHVTGWSFRIYDRSSPQSVTLSVYVVLWACLFSSLSVVADS